MSVKSNQQHVQDAINAALEYRECNTTSNSFAELPDDIARVTDTRQVNRKESSIKDSQLADALDAVMEYRRANERYGNFAPLADA